MKRAPCLLLLFATASLLTADPNAGSHSDRGTIKALGVEEIHQLRAGKGMGMAKAAELNRFPGPMHVLDAADALALTADQVRQIRAIFDDMHRDAVARGEALIAAERRLDGAFKSGEITADQLQNQVLEVAQLRGELRLAHLSAHLRTRALLTAEQVNAYDRIRGYTPRR
jgi:Spy/CpxP family protein refolding chaperone